MFKNIANLFVKSKKYWIIYLIFITITFASTLSAKNFDKPQIVIASFVIVAILGVACILYYFKQDSDRELYKVAFVIILCFGLLSSVIVPIADVSDELEHLTRAEITSRGIIFPHWEDGPNNLTQLYNRTDEGKYSRALNTDVGFNTTASHMFFLNNLGHTVFETPHDTKEISNKSMLDGSAFEQNPFYGYLPQALGVLIAKLFDMNVIWMLWLGRICNLIFYAFLISMAVRITPYLKVPLLAVACIPISIYQAASLSIDSMILGLGILTIAYFIYLYKSEPGSLDVKHVALFCGLALLLGLCKLPYLAFVFLILFVPKENFGDSGILKYMLLGVFIVGLIGVIWSTYSEPALMHSWRSKLNYMNPELQMEYIMNHPAFMLTFFRSIFTYTLGITLNGVFNFFSAASAHHYSDPYLFITVLIWIFLLMILIFYPKKVEFNLKSRLGVLAVLLIIYIGTCFIQLLTWADVGQTNLGISTRYFIPLFALLPIITGFKIDRLEKYAHKLDWFTDKYAMIFIIGFMATLIVAFATKYYY